MSRMILPFIMPKQSLTFNERLQKNKHQSTSRRNLELAEESDEEKNINRFNLLKITNSSDIHNELHSMKLIKSSSAGHIYNQEHFRHTKYSDKGSFMNFYAKLHKSPELKRKGASLETASFNFLQSSKKYKIVPNPIGILKREGDEKIIDISHRRMGDSYVVSVAKSLELSDHVTTLFLGQNRLTDFSIVCLCDTITKNSNLCKNILKLDLSYNKMGSAGVDHLIQYIDDNNCNLGHLNLEGNCLGNRLIIMILNQITSSISSRMNYLNLGENRLDDDSAPELANLVNKCYMLQVLILYQNSLKNHGASLIMSEIKKHTRLKFLDLSWNLIGSKILEDLPSRDELMKYDKNEKNQYYNAQMNELMVNMEYPKKSILKKVISISKPLPSPFCNELCEMFKNPDIELIHLDISHNNLGFTDCSQIALDVKHNHTILGIHVDGNDMWIDELGFIFAIEKNNYQTDHFANSQIFYRVLDKNHSLIKTNILNVKKIRGKNNCWICEGWNEVKFTYKPQSHVFEEGFNNSKVDCKLFLDFEHYKPYDMESENDNTFTIYRMCPPGDMTFFFTCNGVPCDNYGEKTFKLKEAIVHDEIIKKNEDDEEIDPEGESEDNKKVEPKQYIISNVAKSIVQINPNVIDSEELSKLIYYCEPRPCKKIVKKKRVKTPWIFPISLWYYYGYDEYGKYPDIINDAFEFDFKRGNYSNDKELFKIELHDRLKETLRQAYPQLLECYRNLSAVSGFSRWQISQNTISEFAASAPGLLDQKYVINDVLVKLTEVKSNALDKEAKKKNPNFPENIIRHQWMMLLYKIAKDKYFRTKLKPTVPDAVECAFDEHFIPYLNQFNNQNWRKDRYYNEMVDNLLKAYLPIFDAVYKSNATQKIIGRKDSAYMWLDEFTYIVNSVVFSLNDNEFPAKEIPVIFNVSMMQQVNEIDYERHYNMMFPEFLEAFCRFVDKLSPIPPGDRGRVDWTMQRRIDQPLYAKLENVMPSMWKLITNVYKNVKDKFPTLTRDPEYNLLVYDMMSPFYNNLLPRSKRKRTRKETRNATRKDDTIKENDN